MFGRRRKNDNSVETNTPESEATTRSQGPWDIAEQPDLDERVDLGALRLQGVPGLELRLELDQNTGEVSSAHAVIADSTMQLQAFAAPKSRGIWDDIRAEITEAITSGGGTVDVLDGDFGPELRTRMPQAGPDGRTVYAPARFVGVDGPRWFLRAVLSGTAAIDDAAAAPLLEVVRTAVVVRGDGPMAPRELLPLTVPENSTPVDETEPTRDDLAPFERGPEITEVR
ncbi:DUF3710 domain-containing protein [Kribbia dieselivorans]|uniref:DUF3710 domain-containing protein n=1 Tax=Kribbia dieselivorans TaxID=331526 RepID=UPI000A884B99|nr:DUF3710 domain-containing protein [Kribbia dieselivorans]